MDEAELSWKGRDCATLSNNYSMNIAKDVKDMDGTSCLSSSKINSWCESG
jgi:hypothetical protein